MTTIESQLNAVVWNTAKIVVNEPGWLNDIELTCSDVKAQFTQQAAENPFAADLLNEACGRVLSIVRGYHAALEANDSDAVLSTYFDLIPPDLQAKMHKRAMTALADCGITAEQFKDENGVTFLKVEGIEKLGVPDAEIARMNAMAGDMPAPVGQLHRVH